jgi:hypothetical protein
MNSQGQIKIKLKPFWIDLPRERENTFYTLKRALKKVEAIANQENLDMKLRLEAFRLVGYIAQCMSGMIKDFQIEEITKEVEMLERATGK